MFALILYALITSVYSESNYVAVGTAQVKKTVLAFPKPVSISTETDRSGTVAVLQKVVVDDLLFMDTFSFLPESSSPEKTNTLGADYLIKTNVTVSGNTVTLEANVHELKNGTALLSKKYVAETRDNRTLAHSLANDIVKTLTGNPGIFLTKIAMSCDKSGKAEIYVMDFDGSNTRQITSHRSRALSPGWSPDGKKIAYSLYARQKGNVKNLDLYQYDFTTQTISLLSNRRGNNTGPSYSPDGSQIALAMTFLEPGNSELFLLDLKSKSVTRLTSSEGQDVEPTWSPDGRYIAFSSNRTGRPVIYRMGSDGSNPIRITPTQGVVYYSSPTWSPRNNKIAFAGWKEGDRCFDIFIMNPDGSTIERLTKGQGCNEDPNFSPEGNFLTFSSNRTGARNIYAMNIDGTFVKRLTFGLGNCTSPKWSNPPTP
jgi:TolB protein